MKVDVKIEMDLIKNWNGIYIPPAPALGQYCQLWHIELVLRHFVYAVLRLTHGQNWKKAISEIKVGTEGISLLVLLEKEVSKAKDRNEFADNTLPNLLWFSTTDQLTQIIRNKTNWSHCFSKVFELKKKDFNKFIEPLTHNRNRWAHFRPLAPEVSHLGQIMEFLKKPLADWMAYKYWNSNPIKKEDFDKIVEKYQSKVPDGVPLTIDLHGITGFLDPNKKLDRGYTLLLEENEEENCYWAKLYNIGGPAVWSFDAALDCAIELGEKAIHVAINYKLFTPLEKAKEQGLDYISISFSKKDGRENLIEGMSIISEVVLKQKMQHSPKFSDKPELTATEMTRILFYEAPWNVIIAPTQEGKIHGIVRSQ